MKCITPIILFFIVLVHLSGCSYGPEIKTPDLANGSYQEVLKRFQAGIGDPKQQGEYHLDKERMVIYSSKEAKSKPRVYKPEIDCFDSETSMDLDEIPLVTMNLVESDIREAIIEISMTTEVPIVMDETVDGIVTANIMDQPITVALDMILSSGNYAYKFKDSFILVGSSAPDNPSIMELSDSCVYKPENMQPSQIVELLSPYYRQYVTFSKNSRQLTIIAPKNIQKRLQADILRLDIPPEQVLLEVSIVEVSSDALRIMGIDWGQLMFIDNRNVNATNIGIANNGMDQTLAVSSVMSSMANPYITFLSAIKFLEDKGMAVVKGMPSIVTLDGHSANFNSTQTIWFTPLQNVELNSKTYEITYGINLEIVPKLAHNNMVKLDIIKAGVSDMTQSQRGTSPKIISHTISNTIRVGDGETLVMGGLLQKKNFMKSSKVPGLADIPAAGLLFQQDGRGSYTTEVLIVITPRILKSNEMMG